MVEVNPNFIEDVKKLGAFDVSACYNCGTCTAICPLATEGHEFPRKLIRYSILGLEDKALASPELWLCYYCGECTKSCPRQADPGGLMMALRRYAMEKYSWGKIGSAFYYNPIVAGLSWLILTIFAIFGIYYFIGPIPPVKLTYLPILGISVLEFSEKGLGFLHITGLLLGVFVGLSALANLLIMYAHLRKNESFSISTKNIPVGTKIWLWIKNLIVVIIREVAVQKRYLKCENRNRYYAHMSLLWGFTGLFAATLIGFGIDFYNLAISRLVPFTVGTVFGIVLMYGSGYFLYKRFAKNEEFAEYSHSTDWIFTGLLFFIGLTGFLVAIFRFSLAPMAWYITFAVHLTLVFDLLVTAPFTKFMHSLYRPLAIWISDTRDQLNKIALSAEVKEEVKQEVPA